MIEILIPPLGDGVTHATIVQWHKSPGDTVAKGDILVDVMTDKMNVDVESPASGVLAEILCAAEEEVRPDAVLGRIRPPEEAGS